MTPCLKRSSGYEKLDVVVRGYNQMTNTYDYAIILPSGKVTWQDGKNMGAGATREAEKIYDELKKLKKGDKNEIEDEVSGLSL